MSEQRKVKEMGASMRLGIYPCAIAANTLAHKAYKTKLIQERHRHRFELNNALRSKLIKNGLVIAGTFKGRNLAEIVELRDHPWFVGVQFHPEFLSRPTRPHPLFRDFVAAALVNRLNKESQ
jgi:CTP synthase